MEFGYVTNDVTRPGLAPPLVLSTPRREPAPYKLPWAATYTDMIANRICDEVAAGRTLARICIEETWAPSERQARYWLMDHADFEAAYEVAIQIRADNYAFETIELADTAIDGVNTDSLRIQIGARQWLAGKLRPKYANKTTVDATVAATVNTIAQINVSHMSLEEIQLLEAALRKTIGAEAREVNTEDGEDET